MSEMVKRNLGKPDEVRTFPKGKMEVVNADGLVFGRATFEPGWKWSEHVKPIAGTETCMVTHQGYVVSGKMRVKMNGKELDLGPGDVVVIPPGHDAWTLGDEPCVMYDFTGAASYAKK